MKLVHFTAPDGKPDPINPEQFVDVKAAEPGMYDPRGRAVITLTSGFRVVRETPEEVASKLEAP